jgi:hypothetical protein
MNIGLREPQDGAVQQAEACLMDLGGPEIAIGRGLSRVRLRGVLATSTSLHPDVEAYLVHRYPQGPFLYLHRRIAQAEAASYVIAGATNPKSG